MECNDCARAVTGFIPDFANLQNLFVGGEDVMGEVIGEGRACVAATAVSLVRAAILHTKLYEN